MQEKGSTNGLSRKQLIFEIKAMEKIITTKKKLKKPTDFEEGLVQSWKRWLKKLDPKVTSGGVLSVVAKQKGK